MKFHIRYFQSKYNKGNNNNMASCLNKQLQKLLNKQTKHQSEYPIIDDDFYNPRIDPLIKTVHDMDFPTHIGLCKGIVVYDVRPR